MSHQLSPYIVGGVLVVLVLFKQLRPWWIPIAVLGPALIWTAVHLDAIRGFISFHDVGDAENFLPPPTAVSDGLERLPIVGYSVTALAATILIIGGLAAVVLIQHRRDLLFWAMATAPAVGLVLVFVNPYGREGIFRAVLFAMPWLALMAAHLFRPVDRLPGRLPLLALLTVLTTLFMVAGFGMDRINVIRSGDLAALRYFSAAGTGQLGERQYLLDLGKGNLPNSPPRSTDTHDMVTRGTLKLPVGQEGVTDPPAVVEQLTASLVAHANAKSRKAPDLYALWSPTSADYMLAYGIQTPQDFAALRDAFIGSPYWQTVLQQDGTYVFHLDGASYDATRH